MGKETIQKNMLEFFSKHRLCVVSTVHASGKGTESALVGFAEKENLEIFFRTSNKSRKYANIKAHPHVSVVIGWAPELGSVQYEGEARELEGEEAAEAVAAMTAKNNNNGKFVDAEDQVYFRVIPSWARFLDNGGAEPGVYEVNF